MNDNNLASVAKSLVASGKGLLAADESTGTIKKRFEAVGLVSSPELNRKYREMLLSTPGIEEFISGVIMFDETVRQETGGTPFPKYLEGKGIIPGIKVDEGREPFDGEEVAKGLEGLKTRLPEYKKMGLAFTKWRAPVAITEVYPSTEMLEESARRMAEYAYLSQENGFVPIVEPEVLIDGNHTTTRCEEVTVATLKTLFSALEKRGVALEKALLKTNMVLPGKDSGVKADSLEVAEATLRALKAVVPATLPGIVFLSGGQTPSEATVNLNEINKRKGDVPWELSFSFARALQEEALNIWQGEDANINKAQGAFQKRARLVSLARKGEYSPEMENE
jgi:fructose-bisphosphate aldolase class I